MSHDQFCKGVDRLYFEMFKKELKPTVKIDDQQSTDWNSPPPPPSPVSMDTPIEKLVSPEVNAVCHMCEGYLFTNQSITFRFCTDCDIRVQKEKRKLQQEADQRTVDYWAGCSKCEHADSIKVVNAEEEKKKQQIIEQFAGCSVV